MASTRGRRVELPLTNKSGGSVAAGDVVVIDTANDDSFTTTTTGQWQKSVGIAQETIANNATGRILVMGEAALVNVPASVTRGHFLETHTVAKQGTGNSTRRAGSFGQFKTGGTTPKAWLWGFPDNAGAAGSTVATDAIWDAAGDLAVGTGADTAARLAKGAAGAELGMSNGSVAWTAGTSFPGSPAAGDRYYRTDRGIEYYYDGTRWLSTQVFLHPFGSLDNQSATATALTGRGVLWGPTYDCWVVNVRFWILVSGTNNGTSYWSFACDKVDTAGTLSSVASGNTSADAGSTQLQKVVSVGALLGTSTVRIQLTITKTSAPGNCYAAGSIEYRLVG